MSRKSSPRMRTLRLALFAVALGASPARADDVHVGFRMLTQDDGGGTTAAAPPPVTIADIAGPARTVTLPELLAMAMKQAPDLALAEIDIEVAAAGIERVRGIDDWTVAADLIASNRYSSLIEGGQRFTSTRTGVSGSVDVTRLLPWGGSVILHGESGWARSETDMGAAEEFTDEISATWTQPLLEGRGRRFARAAIAQAEIREDSLVLARRQAAIAIVRDVIVAYWDLVLAQRDLEIRKSSLVLAQERLRRTQAQIAGGGVAKTEALAVEQVIAQREEEVLTQELAVLDRSLALRRLVGMAIGPGELALATTTELGVPDQPWDLPALIAEAYRTSPELAQLAHEEKIATIEVEVTENGLLPSLDLSLTFGPIGSDDTAVGALESMGKFENTAAIGQLSFEHSIGNRAARGAARAARAERLRVKVNAQDLRAALAESIASAVVLAETAARRVAIASKAIELADQNIAAEQSRFTLGKSTNFDVLQRQEELKEAQLRQARAIIDWQKASTVIAAISGGLLERYGIALGER